MAGDAYYLALLGGFKPNTSYVIQFKDTASVGASAVPMDRWGSAIWYLEAPGVLDPTLDLDNSRLEVFQDLNGSNTWDDGEPGAFGEYFVWPFEA